MKYLFGAWDKLKKNFSNSHICLLLDYDGTLTPIVNSPDLATLSAEMRNLLRELAAKPACSVAIVSGRALKDVKKMIAVEDLVYAGNHGLEIEGPGIMFENRISPHLFSIMRNLAEELNAGLSEIKGISLEDKNITLSVHYRLASRAGYLLAKKTVDKIARPFLINNQIEVNDGKKILEIKPSVQWNKGTAIAWLLAQHPFISDSRPCMPVYLGDDVTDEDAFAMLKDRGLAVYIGMPPKKSHATYYLRNTQEVYEFLKEILSISGN